jgi:type IV pilus assembly protein PilC
MNYIQKITDSLQRIPVTAKIFLLQNLSVMVKAGVSLTDGLTTIEEQTSNPKLKRILKAAATEIKAGKTFAEALTPYHNDFGELFINMIRAGELSGRLEEVLHELYTQTKRDHSLMLKIRNAMTYPVIIVCAMFGIAGFVVVFVLPNITALFSELDVELPLATRVVIGGSNFLQSYGLWVMAVILPLLLILIKISRTSAGKYALDRLLLKTPVVGSIIKKINIARLTRSLSSLIKTDIPIVDTLSITAHVLSNSVYTRALENAAERIKKGQKLGVILSENKTLFPPTVIQMISIGEETGALDEILENIATFYEEEVFQTMDSLPTIIEPLLMILIGMGVAGIAIAVLMPMYSLSDSF